jgi:sugar lactone lactonase YvrE
MTNRQLGRWLLVALAIVGLALAAPAVSAHGDEQTQGNETAADGMPTDTDGTGWAAWMDAQMTEHMGPGAVEAMESHMGATVDEMTEYMAGGTHNRGMTGQGQGC